MSANVIYRNLRNYSNLNLILKRAVKNQQFFFKKNGYTTLSSPTLKNNVEQNFINNRYFSNENSNPPSNKFPPLLPDQPIVIWPSLIKSIRNFILANFIIKPYLDREFSLADFVNASKKAVEVISRKLAEGDIKSLENLVTNDIISSLQKAMSLMSMSQREQISIDTDDIYFSFPYQIGIIFNEEGAEQKRFVEITMVYHSLKGLANMRSRGEEPPLNMGMLPEYQQRISICNYRFIREFTKGVEGDWTVNLLNHFKPADENK
ncbi:m-AAA protease-interacting protein 1, mitochondrial [Diorhabda carinulata]|uniref:m-AAA protease-interacting protein 1, mitochondrial n=1 Tax=Diorhabda carinulata TaxID=1163345 RepID=UPI0025A23946|nr:m-AAA protease-interacting protein 1, mitochondrial [Diorhabda carinulata]